VCCWNPKLLFQDFKIDKVITEANKLWQKGETVDTKKMRKIIKEGPVSSAVAVNRDFQFYSSGILMASKCPNTQLNHAVVTVG